MRRFIETQDTQTQSNILVYRDFSFQKTAADALEKLTVEKEGNGGVWGNQIDYDKSTSRKKNLGLKEGWRNLGHG